MSLCPEYDVKLLKKILKGKEIVKEIICVYDDCDHRRFDRIAVLEERGYTEISLEKFLCFCGYEDPEDALFFTFGKKFDRGRESSSFYCY